MSVVFPIAIFLLVGLLWLASWIQGHRLLYRFQFKYREKAIEEIPHAFEAFAHPEKLMYFFRKKTRDFLISDAEIWALCRQVYWLVILSAIMPVVLIFTLLGVALYAFHRT